MYAYWVTYRMLFCLKLFVIKVSSSGLWSSLVWSLALASVTLNMCFCFSLSISLPLISSPLPSSPCSGRVSLTQNASLLVERLTQEDEGWFKCNIFGMDRNTDDFHNTTWTWLSITGATLWELFTVTFLPGL